MTGKGRAAAAAADPADAVDSGDAESAEERKMTRLALERIRVDGRAQLRAASSPATVADYTAALRDGATFPPIVVFHDGSYDWLAGDAP
jgi:hypothetical protein